MSVIAEFTVESDDFAVNCPAHGGAGLVSELGLYPESGGPVYLANSASLLLT
ncbi:hypothetical protein ACLI4Z_11480 [Natrialbaceae archaeon A-arb3/5]